MRRIALSLCLFVVIDAHSQFSSLSRYEKRWAFFHPFAALEVKKITKKCYVIYLQPEIKLRLDTFSNGGKLDAFRHTFFMAAYAQKIKEKKLRQLGKAHEKGNYRQFLRSKKEEGEVPDSLSSVMDLFNNEVGLQLGKSNKKTLLPQLCEIIIARIAEGSVLIMRRNKNSVYIDCTGGEIHPEHYAGKWAIPKCLVTSDQ